MHVAQVQTTLTGVQPSGSSSAHFAPVARRLAASPAPNVRFLSRAAASGIGEPPSVPTGHAGSIPNAFALCEPARSAASGAGAGATLMPNLSSVQIPRGPPAPGPPAGAPLHASSAPASSAPSPLPATRAWAAAVTPMHGDVEVASGPGRPFAVSTGFAAANRKTSAGCTSTPRDRARGRSPAAVSPIRAQPTPGLMFSGPLSGWESAGSPSAPSAAANVRRPSPAVSMRCGWGTNSTASMAPSDNQRQIADALRWGGQLPTRLQAPSQTLSPPQPLYGGDLPNSQASTAASQAGRPTMSTVPPPAVSSIANIGAPRGGGSVTTSVGGATSIASIATSVASGTSTTADGGAAVSPALTPRHSHARHCTTPPRFWAPPPASALPAPGGLLAPAAVVALGSAAGSPTPPAPPSTASACSTPGGDKGKAVQPSYSTSAAPLSVLASQAASMSSGSGIVTPVTDDGQVRPAARGRQARSKASMSPSPAYASTASCSSTGARSAYKGGDKGADGHRSAPTTVKSPPQAAGASAAGKSSERVLNAVFLLPNVSESDEFMQVVFNSFVEDQPEVAETSRLAVPVAVDPKSEVAQVALHQLGPVDALEDVQRRARRVQSRKPPVSMRRSSARPKFSAVNGLPKVEDAESASSTLVAYLVRPFESAKDAERQMGPILIIEASYQGSSHTHVPHRFVVALEDPGDFITPPASPGSSAPRDVDGCVVEVEVGGTSSTQSSSCGERRPVGPFGCRVMEKLKQRNVSLPVVSVERRNFAWHRWLMKNVARLLSGIAGFPGRPMPTARKAALVEDKEAKAEEEAEVDSPRGRRSARRCVQRQSPPRSRNSSGVVGDAACDASEGVANGASDVAKSAHTAEASLSAPSPQPLPATLMGKTSSSRERIVDGRCESAPTSTPAGSETVSPQPMERHRSPAVICQANGRQLSPPPNAASAAVAAATAAFDARTVGNQANADGRCMETSEWPAKTTATQAVAVAAAAAAAAAVRSAVVENAPRQTSTDCPFLFKPPVKPTSSPFLTQRARPTAPLRESGSGSRSRGRLSPPLPAPSAQEDARWSSRSSSPTWRRQWRWADAPIPADSPRCVSPTPVASSAFPAPTVAEHRVPSGAMSANSGVAASAAAQARLAPLAEVVVSTGPAAVAAVSAPQDSRNGDVVIATTAGLHQEVRVACLQPSPPVVDEASPYAHAVPLPSPGVPHEQQAAEDLAKVLEKEHSSAALQTDNVGEVNANAEEPAPIIQVGESNFCLPEPAYAVQRVGELWVPGATMVVITTEHYGTPLFCPGGDIRNGLINLAPSREGSQQLVPLYWQNLDTDAGADASYGSQTHTLSGLSNKHRLLGSTSAPPLPTMLEEDEEEEEEVEAERPASEEQHVSKDKG